MSAEIKIAYIGGGSKAWAFKLMSDLALCPLLKGELALYDIDYAAAERNVKLADGIFNHPEAKTKFHVTAAKKPEEALKGADFVVCSIEPGPTELRYADLEIPAKYGIIQTVGDTTGPGGIMRALRTIPVKANYAHLVMEHCPSAWLINYTNPMTLCTSAFYAAEPKIKAFGCCHEVFGTQEFLAGKVKEWFGVESVDRREIVLDIAGVNHFTFATSAHWKGKNLFPKLIELVSNEKTFSDRSEVAAERVKKGLWFESDHLIALDFLRRFGVLGAAGDRHLVEFVPWYLRSEKELHRWGVICTPYSWRIIRSKEKAVVPTKLTPSGEEGVDQMLALLGLVPLDTNVNLPNHGQMPDMPLGAVVETYAQFRQNSIRPIVSAKLAPCISEAVRRVVTVQQLTLKAAMEGDIELAFQAMLADPLVTISTDLAWKMFKEMLEYTSDYIPGQKRPK